MKISVLTPTCDRPIGFALCEKMMARQTLQPDEWIVADGSNHETPTSLTMGQRRIAAFDHPPGAKNFACNLLNGIAAATGDLLIIVEDDDWYAPNHIETMARMAVNNPSALLIGASDQQNYYNVAHRVWKVYNNFGASMCQSGMRRDVFALFRKTINECAARGNYGVDTTLWRAVPRTKWALARELTVVGIKGLPGRAGLGVGHRPAGTGWTPDPKLTKLRGWIGDDADGYAGFALSRAA